MLIPNKLLAKITICDSNQESTAKNVLKLNIRHVLTLESLTVEKTKKLKHADFDANMPQVSFLQCFLCRREKELMMEHMVCGGICSFDSTLSCMQRCDSHWHSA